MGTLPAYLTLSIFLGGPLLSAAALLELLMPTWAACGL